MHKELIDILRCPLCKSELTLRNPEYDRDEIKSGFLGCTRCPGQFKIINFIPLMVDTADPRFQKLETVTLWGKQWLNEDWIKETQYYRKELLDLEYSEWNLPEHWLDGKKILDVGCGNGRHSLILKRFKFAVCVAFDLSESIYYMLHKEEFKGIHLVRADMMNPPFADNYFDFILARQVLQHTREPGLSTKTLARALRSGGFFLSSYYKTPEKILTLIKLRLIECIRKVISIFPQGFVYYFTWLSIPCYKYRILYPLGRLIFLQSKYDKTDAMTWNMNHDQYINSYQHTYTHEEATGFLNAAGLHNHVESSEWPGMFRSTKK